MQTGTMSSLKAAEGGRDVCGRTLQRRGELLTRWEGEETPDRECGEVGWEMERVKEMPQTWR